MQSEEILSRKTALVQLIKHECFAWHQGIANTIIPGPFHLCTPRDHLFQWQHIHQRCHLASQTHWTTKSAQTAPGYLASHTAWSKYSAHFCKPTIVWSFPCPHAQNENSLFPGKLSHSLDLHVGRAVIIHYSLLANVRQIYSATAVKSGRVTAWKATVESAGLKGSGRWCETINLVCLALSPDPEKYSYGLDLAKLHHNEFFDSGIWSWS